MTDPAGNKEPPIEMRDVSANTGSDASPRKATLAQVAYTMCWALVMIGKKGTWERDGATLTMTQAVVGGVIMCAIVVGVLIGLVKYATS
jgi:ABC-type proline/glycine betaine transport system permease subunit